MALQKADILGKKAREPLEDADQEPGEAFEDWSLAKSKVDCICPGCGKMHVTKMRWTGRGVPRKFCQSCRDRETPLDDQA
jgi:transposase-like protein